jgi:hypothetical protein
MAGNAGMGAVIGATAGGVASAAQEGEAIKLPSETLIEFRLEHSLHHCRRDRAGTARARGTRATAASSCAESVQETRANLFAAIFALALTLVLGTTAIANCLS